MTKVCNTCLKEQALDRFRAGSAKCRQCAYEKKLEWQEKNPDKLRAGLRRAYRRNKVKILAQMKRRRLTIKDEISARRKAARKDPSTADYQYRFGKGRKHYLAKKRIYNAKARPKQREYVKRRLKTDPNFKMRRTLVRFIRDGIFDGSRSGLAKKMLGCSIESFKLYLESKFESGMNWDNYGGTDGWQIDHIMPLAIFNLTKPEHQRRAFHFSNMQPLWAKQNRAKGAKVLDPQFPLI